MKRISLMVTALGRALAAGAAFASRNGRERYTPSPRNPGSAGISLEHGWPADETLALLVHGLPETAYRWHPGSDTPTPPITVAVGESAGIGLEHGWPLDETLAQLRAAGQAGGAGLGVPTPKTE